MKLNFSIITVISLSLCLGLFVAVSCNGPEFESTSNAQVADTKVLQNSLEQTATKLAELYNNKNCMEFVNTFPNNFEEFNQLYGYDDKVGPRILYSKPEHVTYFFECSEVPVVEKLKKSIEIGINGKWDADLIGIFQDKTFNLVKSHSTEAKEILNKLPNEKAASFLYFLLDNPHPNDKEIVKKVDLLNNLLGKSSKLSRLLSEQYQKVQIDWKEH